MEFLVGLIHSSEEIKMKKANPWVSILRPINDEPIIRELLARTIERCMEIIHKMEGINYFSDSDLDDIKGQLEALRANGPLNWCMRSTIYSGGHRITHIFLSQFWDLLQEMEYWRNSNPTLAQLKTWLYGALSIERWAYDPEYDNALIMTQQKWLKDTIKRLK